MRSLVNAWPVVLGVGKTVLITGVEPQCGQNRLGATVVRQLHQDIQIPKAPQGRIPVGEHAQYRSLQA